MHKAGFKLEGAQKSLFDFLAAHPQLMMPGGTDGRSLEFANCPLAVCPLSIYCAHAGSAVPPSKGQIAWQPRAIGQSSSALNAAHTPSFTNVPVPSSPLLLLAELQALVALLADFGLQPDEAAATVAACPALMRTSHNHMRSVVNLLRSSGFRQADVAAVLRGFPRVLVSE